MKMDRSKSAQRQMDNRRSVGVPTRAELDKSRRTAAQMRTEKLCKGCDRTLPLAEFHRDSSKKNIDGRRSKCASCERERQASGRRAKGMQFRGSPVLFPSRNPIDAQIQRSLESARDRSRDRGQEFTLTAGFVSDLLKSHARCAITNRAFDFSPPSDGTHFNRDRFSIDRIDSSRGYTPDNVQLVTVAANMAKNSMSTEQLVDLAVDIARHAGFEVTAPKRTLH